MTMTAQATWAGVMASQTDLAEGIDCFVWDIFPTSYNSVCFDHIRDDGAYGKL